MERIFAFSGEELYTLRYTLCQRMYSLEALIEETRCLEPQNTTKLIRLEDVLFTLESIHYKMFEGGESDEK